MLLATSVRLRHRCRGLWSIDCRRTTEQAEVVESLGRKVCRHQASSRQVGTMGGQRERRVERDVIEYKTRGSPQLDASPVAQAWLSSPHSLYSTHSAQSITLHNDTLTHFMLSTVSARLHLRPPPAALGHVVVRPARPPASW